MSTPVIIDHGSYSTKAGFSGCEEPEVVIPTLIGRSQRGSEHAEYYVGEEAQEKLFRRHPIERGIITSIDDMEKIWHHVFYNELHVAPQEHPVFATEAMWGPKANRERIVQIMFENFHVPAFHIGIQSVLSLFSTGHQTGIVVECGGGTTYVVPVYEGYGLPHAVMRLDYSGNCLTRYMKALLASHPSPYLRDFRVVNDIKERLGSVALDYGSVGDSADNEKYELPDGQVVSIGNERFQLAEALFQPSLIGIEHSVGIHEATLTSIKKCDEECRKELYKHVILAGGSSLFPGLAERFHKELTAIAPPDTHITVNAPEDRKYSAWIGASLLTSLDSFQHLWISNEEYQEYGPASVHRKCF